MSICFGFVRCIVLYVYLSCAIEYSGQVWQFFLNFIDTVTVQSFWQLALLVLYVVCQISRKWLQDGIILYQTFKLTLIFVLKNFEILYNYKRLHLLSIFRLQKHKFITSFTLLVTVGSDTCYRYFNFKVYRYIPSKRKTLFWRCNNVETKSCAYWVKRK